jgi:hypothetical protein
MSQIQGAGDWLVNVLMQEQQALASSAAGFPPAAPRNKTSRKGVRGSEFQESSRILLAR